MNGYNYFKLYRETPNGERSELHFVCCLNILTAKQQMKGFIRKNPNSFYEWENLILRNEDSGEEWMLTLNWERI